MSFRVRVEPSGHEFEVRERETVLEAALRDGLSMVYSCRNGACGSCKGRILDGVVEYGRYERRALSDRERSGGKALFCQAVPLSDLVIEAREVGAARGIQVRTLPVRIVQKTLLAPDVMALSLKRPEAEAFRFLAGQYLDVLLKDGRRRSFSLANAPDNAALLEIHVRRVAGGHFSEQVFTALPEKSLLRIEGPLGTFFLDEASPRPVLLVGGGTGFAPLKSMVEHAIAIGWERPMHLFWGGHASADLYHDDLVHSWVTQRTGFQYTPVLSAPDAEWRGERGYVPQALVHHYPDLSGVDVYASGPPALITGAKALFATHGLPEERFYYDSFEYAVDSPI